jgi:hypothetical protein
VIGAYFNDEICSGSKSLLCLSVASNDKMFDIPFAKTLLNLSRMILPTLPGTFFNKFSQCLTTEIDSHKDLSNFLIKLLKKT